MSQDRNGDIEQLERALQTLTSVELSKFLLEKMPNGVVCTLCNSRDVNIIGTKEQLFTFKIPTAYTDAKDDDRVIYTAVLECGDCGHLIFVSPNALFKSIGVKLS